MKLNKHIKIALAFTVFPVRNKPHRHVKPFGKLTARKIVFRSQSVKLFCKIVLHIIILEQNVPKYLTWNKMFRIIYA